MAEPDVVPARDDRPISFTPGTTETETEGGEGAEFVLGDTGGARSHGFGGGQSGEPSRPPQQVHFPLGLDEAEPVEHGREVPHLQSGKAPSQQLGEMPLPVLGLRPSVRGHQPPRSQELVTCAALLCRREGREALECAPFQHKSLQIEAHRLG